MDVTKEAGHDLSRWNVALRGHRVRFPRFLFGESFRASDCRSTVAAVLSSARLESS